MNKLYYKAIRKPRFTAARKEFITAIVQLVQRTVEQVGQVTVRQVYYQAVNAGLVESGDKSYRRVQAAIGKARECGLVAWNAIEDRGRAARKPYCETSPVDAITELAEHYRLDRSAGQRFRVEVWLEQAALREIVWPVCAELGAVLVVCGGFTSHDALFKASERFRGYAQAGQQPIILHLSDLDPSGVRMGAAIADIVERLLDDNFDPEADPDEFEEDDEPPFSDDYAYALEWGCARRASSVYVQRVGLTIEQAKRYGLLARPLKVNDTRAASYREEHGDWAYELDGLPAGVLQDLVRKSIEPLIDWAERDRVLAIEAKHKAALRELVELGKAEGLL